MLVNSVRQKPFHKVSPGPQKPPRLLATACGFHDRTKHCGLINWALLQVGHDRLFSGHFDLRRQYTGFVREELLHTPKCTREDSWRHGLKSTCGFREDGLEMLELLPCVLSFTVRVVIGRIEIGV